MSERPRSTRGISEGLVAAAIGAPFGYLFPNGWKYFFGHDPPEWATATLPNVFAAAIFFAASWVLAKEWSRRATAAAKRDRLAIYVAQLDGDNEKGTLRRSVIDTIVRELGRSAVEVLPAGILLKLREDVSDDLAALDAMKEARKLLQHKLGQLLIWGRVHSWGGQPPQIELRFVSDVTDRSEGSRFGLTEKLLLKPEFLSNTNGIRE